MRTDTRRDNADESGYASKVIARGRSTLIGALSAASERAVRRLLPWFFLVVPLAGSGCSEANKVTYKEAAIATGIAVASVGIYRAVTRDCWARCRTGYVCNEETGLCELGECLPGCEYGTHCARDTRGDYRCVTDFGNLSFGSSTSAPAASATGPTDAGVPTDAGFTSDAGLTGAATSPEPAAQSPEL
jgi:hypothetical protein